MAITATTPNTLRTFTGVSFVRGSLGRGAPYSENQNAEDLRCEIVCRSPSAATDHLRGQSLRSEVAHITPPLHIFAAVLLHTRQWGSRGAPPVICIHGVTQHGGVFQPLAERLVSLGHRVVAVDLRGHGASGREPPWSEAVHVDDLLETASALGVERGTWIGHSFGGRLAARVAARAPERVRSLVLLDPGLEVPPEVALRCAEIDRLDWSFASVDGAVNALLSGAAVVATPQTTVETYVREDVRQGPDGRFRFSACASAVVVAWSEMASPAPPVAVVPTLLVRPGTSLTDGRLDDERYEQALGDLLTITAVPNGHNVLWESPAETSAAVEAFLIAAA